jgi:hypothetical protein
MRLPIPAFAMSGLAGGGFLTMVQPMLTDGGAKVGESAKK